MMVSPTNRIDTSILRCPPQFHKIVTRMWWYPDTFNVHLLSSAFSFFNLEVNGLRRSRLI